MGFLDGFHGYETTALPQAYGFDNIDGIIATSTIGLSGDELYEPDANVRWDINGVDGSLTLGTRYS